MAGITIIRNVWVDDSGTIDLPNDDGTVVDNGELQTIYDKVDELHSGVRPFTLGGLIKVEGFGIHTLVAGGVGGQELQIRNTAAGAGNYAALRIGNDVNALQTSVYTTSSTYAGGPGGNASVVASAGAGGLLLTSENGVARGIDIMTAGRPIVIQPGNMFGSLPDRPAIRVRGVTDPGGGWEGITLDGTVTAGDVGVGIGLRPTVNTSGAFTVGVHITPTFSGTGQLFGTRFAAPTWTGTTGTYGVTVAIDGPPVGGPGARNALLVQAGTSFFAEDVFCGTQFKVANGTAAAPGFAFSGAPGNGLYFNPSSGTGALKLGVHGSPVIAAFKDGFNLTQLTIGTPSSAGADHTNVINIQGDQVWVGGVGGGDDVFLNSPNIWAPAIGILSGANYIHWSANQLWRTSSSARYKRAIRDLDPAGDVLTLRPRLYEDAAAAGDARSWPGFIAEEVAEVMPDLVQYNAEGAPETVLYDRIPAYLLLAMRAMSARLAALEARG